MLWLVLGAVILSWLRGLNKKRLLWSLMLIVLLLAFLSNTLLMFYIFFELSLVPILLMILFWGRQPERLQAGLYLLIYTGILSLPYVIFVVLLKKSFYSGLILSCSSIIIIIFLSPFLVKMPVFGLHFWLPKAHVEARTGGSIILAGILLKLGSYGIYRIIAIVYCLAFFLRRSFWLILSILARILTFIQTDLKKLVAYRRVTHITFLMLRLRINNKVFFLNCLILSLAHGWVSIGIFYVTGTVSGRINSRLSFLMGRENKFHWRIILLGILLLINAALPPFPSFFAELLTVCSLIRVRLVILFFILYSLLVCYYNTYIFMWTGHNKNIEAIFNKFTSAEATLLIRFILFNVPTLRWLVLI